MKTTQEKKQSKSNPLGAGRKRFDGKDEKEVVAKLEEATAIDASVEECLFYADISRDSYYRYLKANPDFATRLAKLREKPVMLARKTAVTKLTESYSNAMDYLKRKKKVEFGDSTDITSGGEKINEFDEKQIERIARRVLNGNSTGEERPGQLHDSNQPEV